MFQNFRFHVNLISKDSDQKPKSETILTRLDAETVELVVEEQPGPVPAAVRESSKEFGSKGGFFDNPANSLPRGFTKKAVQYKFKRILGPGLETLKLHHEIGFPVDCSKLTTIISLGKYYPTVLNMNDSTMVKGLLGQILKEIFQLAEAGPVQLFLSCFTFHNRSLLNLVESEDTQTQMLFNFELNYLEFDKATHQSLPSKIKNMLSKKLSTFNFNPPMIFFYLSARTPHSPAPFRYLLVDVYQTFLKPAKSGGPSLFSPEVAVMLKYVGFEAQNDSVNAEEQTDSLDLFFNELVQEKQQNFSLFTNVPIGASNLHEAQLLLGFSAKLEAIASIYSSYTFQLVHSQTQKIVPIRSVDLSASSRKSKPMQPESSQRQMDQEERPRQPSAGALQACDLSKKIEDCVEQFSTRLRYKDELVQMQNALLAQIVDFSKSKQDISQSNSEELIKHIEELDYDLKYLKNLIQCIAEYRTTKDESFKSKLVSSISNLTRYFERKTLSGLTLLLTNAPP